MLSEDARIENGIIRTLEQSTLRKRSLKHLLGELLLSQPKAATHNSALIQSESLTDSGGQLFRSYYDFARHNVRPKQFEDIATLLPASELDEIVDTYYQSQKNPQIIPRDLALLVQAAKAKVRELKLDARVSKLLYQKSNASMQYSACLIVQKLYEKHDQMSVSAGRQLIRQLQQLSNFPDFLLRVAVDEAFDGDAAELRGRILEMLPSALFSPEVSELVRQRVESIKNAGQLLYVLDVVEKYQITDRSSELLKCVNKYSQEEKEAYVHLLAASQGEVELSTDVQRKIADMLRTSACPADVQAAVQRASRYARIRVQDALCIQFLHDIFCKAPPSPDPRQKVRLSYPSSESSHTSGKAEQQQSLVFSNAETQTNDLQLIIRQIIALLPPNRRPNSMSVPQITAGQLITEMKAASLEFQGARAYKQLLCHLIAKLEHSMGGIQTIPAEALAELKTCADALRGFRGELFEYVTDEPVVYQRRTQAFTGLLQLYFRQKEGASFSACSPRDQNAVIEILQQCAALAASLDQPELVECVKKDLDKMRGDSFYFPSSYLRAVDELYIYLLNLQNESKESQISQVIQTLPADFPGADRLLFTYIRHYQQLLTDKKLDQEQQQRVQRIIGILNENRQLLAQINASGVSSPVGSGAAVLSLSGAQPEGDSPVDAMQSEIEADYMADAPVLSRFRKRSVAFSACQKLNTQFNRMRASSEEATTEIPVQGLTIAMASLQPKRSVDIAIAATSTRYPPVQPIPARSASLQRMSPRSEALSEGDSAAKAKPEASGMSCQTAARLEQLLELYQHPDQKKSGLADAQRRRSHELITVLANAVVLGTGRAAFSQKMNMVRRHFILNSTKCSRQQLSEGIKILKAIAEECGVRV